MRSMSIKIGTTQNMLGQKVDQKLKVWLKKNPVLKQLTGIA